MAQNKNLSIEQNEVITELLEGSSVREIAKNCKVSASTIYRWLRLLAFQSELRKAEGIILDKVARKLILLSGQAVDKLADIMRNPTQEGASQARYSAQAILENTLKIWELRNIESRLAEVENKLNEHE